MGDAFNIRGISFWNQNGGGPGVDGATGIRHVVVSSSIDGVSFEPIVGAPSEFSVVPGIGPEFPERFSFDSVVATEIRFEVLSNHGDQKFVGFAEVAFQGNAVPEPNVTMMLAKVWGVFVCLGVRRKRNRKLILSCPN